MKNIDSGEMKDHCMEFCLAFSLNCLLSKFKVNPIPPRNWWIEGWNVNNLLITKSYVVYLNLGMKDDFFQLNNIICQYLDIKIKMTNSLIQPSCSAEHQTNEQRYNNTIGQTLFSL